MNEAERRERLESLKKSWMEQAEADFEDLIPKMLEYGCWSLLVLGEATMPEGEAVSDYERFEAGCATYALGKASRAVGSVRGGQDISRDTLKDLATYANMARVSVELVQAAQASGGGAS